MKKGRTNSLSLFSDTSSQDVFPGRCVVIDEEFEQRKQEKFQRLSKAAIHYIETGSFNFESEKDLAGTLQELNFAEQKNLAYHVKFYIATREQPTPDLDTQRANEIFGYLTPKTVKIAEQWLLEETPKDPCAIF